MSRTYFFYQDSTTLSSADTVTGPAQDSSSVVRRFSIDEADDIFRAMERREKELDSIRQVRAYQAWLRSQQQQQQPEGFDTAAVPYNLGSDSLTLPVNTLDAFSGVYFSSKDTSLPVFRESPVPVNLEKIQETSTEIGIKPEDGIRAETRNTSHDLRPDWLLAVIIGSLVLLAWIRLFFSKFLDQTIQSLANYQLSNKLLRDQSIFSRRVAFALNFNFILTGGALFYLLLGFFNLKPLPFTDFICFLLYTLILAAFILLRYVVSHFIGLVFNKRAEFRDYLHQLLLIYKNLGIYLLVFIIGIAYINEEMRIFLVWPAIILVSAGIIFRLFKGLQIVLNNKDVLIFYLILYLCTLEILPLLIFYRFFSLSVQAG